MSKEFLIRKGDLKTRNYKPGEFLYSGEVYFHVVESSKITDDIDAIRKQIPEIMASLELFKLSTDGIKGIKEIVDKYPQRQQAAP